MLDQAQALNDKINDDSITDAEWRAARHELAQLWESFCTEDVDTQTDEYKQILAIVQNNF